MHKKAHVFAGDDHHSFTYDPSDFHTPTMICAPTFALVFLFAQTALALPQAGSASNTYSSTPTPYTSSYSTTESTPKYTSSPYASSSCPCNPPTAYTPMDKDDSSYSSSYPSSSCSCYSSTPYTSSQPTYTTTSSPYTSSSETYPPTKSSKPYPLDGSEKPYPPKGSETPYPPKGSEKPYPPKGSETPSTPPATSTLRATFDTTFDNKSGSMNNVACSNGANGLAARFPTFGNVPSFPFIGGAFDVVWNSPNCGSCWKVTNPTTGAFINITAIDTAGAGFNIAQEAFVQLNGGQVGLGFLEVVATKVSPSVCGL